MSSHEPHSAWAWTTGRCYCDTPFRMGANCGLCRKPIVAVERTPRPPSGSAVPAAKAGEGASSSPTPADLRAFNDDQTERIQAIFEKRTGRA